MEREYYDCHMHEFHKERGGFLIALDGRRGSIGGYSNEEVLVRAKEKKEIEPVQYVTWNFDKTDTPIIKYHPRRELYTPDEVTDDIKQRKPQGVIIDTLNQPNWQPKDYWMIAKEFQDIPFLFSHAGGFDMLQFLNIAMYQNNVWIDFSFVQNVFGFTSENQPLKQLVELMEYSFQEKRIYRKLLLGTDNMRNEIDCSEAVLQVYSKFVSYDLVVKENFHLLKTKIGIA